MCSVSARHGARHRRSHPQLHLRVHRLARQAARDASPTIEVAREAFEAIWIDRGPTDHAFASDYRPGESVVDGLIKAGAGRKFRECEPLAINYRNGTIIVEPDQIAERVDGVDRRPQGPHGQAWQSELRQAEHELHQKAAAATSRSWRHGRGGASERRWRRRRRASAEQGERKNREATAEAILAASCRASSIPSPSNSPARAVHISSSAPRRQPDL